MIEFWSHRREVFPIIAHHSDKNTYFQMFQRRQAQEGTGSRRQMKHLLLTTIAVVLVVGCGPNIHEATWTGNIEVIKQLIASDIDVNVKRNRGETPLHIAAIFSRYEIAKLLISKGADVNARNDDGFTPLHQAAYSFTEGPQKIRTIELLISKGANVNSKGESGGTPLDIANTWGREPAADLLRKHGGKTGEELEAGN